MWLCRWRAKGMYGVDEALGQLARIDAQRIFIQCFCFGIGPHAPKEDRIHEH